MRIVVDFQGAQSPVHKDREIGRHAASLVEAIARQPLGHEIVLALNGWFADTVDAIRQRFDGLIDPGHIRVWYPPQISVGASSGYPGASEKLYEAFLASLQPDVVHVSSLFEGFDDASVTSIGRFARLPTAVTLHEPGRPIDARARHWLLRKIEALRKADVWFALSESSRRTGVEDLGLDTGRCVVLGRPSEGFAWDECARRAIDSFERLHARRRELPDVRDEPRALPRLAWVSASPAPGDDSAIDSEHLSALSNSYEIVLIAPADGMADRTSRTGPFPLRDTRWFLDNASSFDRVLYHLRDSAQDSHLLGLLEEVPGTVLLHDFHLGHAQAHRELPGDEPHAWTQALYRSHGYAAVAERFHAKPGADIASRYPCNFDVLALAQGVIVRSPRCLELATDWFSAGISKDWALIPFPQQTPSLWASDCAAAIERFTATAAVGRDGLVQCLGRHDGDGASDMPDSEHGLLLLAESIAATLPTPAPRRQLLVDVSELVQRDSRSGIQRVVKALLQALIDAPPAGYRIEPVYARTGQLGYRYANKFTLGFLGCPADALQDAPIDVRRGDMFIGLDLQPHLVPQQAPYFRRLRHSGVRVEFVVYDLLPILLSQHFDAQAARAHARWLTAVAENDGAICISRAVADELLSWLQANAPERLKAGFHVRSFHLGADLTSAGDNEGLPADAGETLAAIGRSNAFLMVGTLEPRKGYAMTLDAFERLWAQGVDVRLVIVGKRGWMVDSLVERLQRHPELGRRLFWVEQASDEYLTKLYGSAGCLIAASEGEGFGLPLIEAAQHGLPVLAANLPVFREVAGEHALYFEGNAASLAATVVSWIELFAQDRHPRSEDMRYLTWRESAEQFKEALFANPR